METKSSICSLKMNHFLKLKLFHEWIGARPFARKEPIRSSSFNKSLCLVVIRSELRPAGQEQVYQLPGIAQEMSGKGGVQKLLLDLGRTVSQPVVETAKSCYWYRASLRLVDPSLHSVCEKLPGSRLIDGEALHRQVTHLTRVPKGVLLAVQVVAVDLFEGLVGESPTGIKRDATEPERRLVLWRSVIPSRHTIGSRKSQQTLLTQWQH